MDPFLNSMPLASAEGGTPHGLSFLGLAVYVGLTVAIMFGLMAAAKKGLGARVFKNAWTSRFEQLFLFIENMCVGIIGNHGRRYIPMMMTLWMVIFTANMLSLFLASAPTADLSFNLGLALVSVGYVQWEGMRSNGVAGHFRHFAGPKLGGPLVLISVMIFVIEMISEVMKNVSLSLRLYGNIDGGHQAVEKMNDLGLSLIHLPGDYTIGIPFGAFLLPIKLLTCVVQALIFTLLTCVYISLVTHDDHEHHVDT
ncbi:ATP synthase F0 subunit A, partial [bacterium]